MKNPAFLPIFALFLLALAGCIQAPQQAGPWTGANHTILVDASSSKGSVSPALSPGIMGGMEPIEYSGAQELSRIEKPMTWRIHYTASIAGMEKRPENEADWAAFESTVRADCAQMKSRFPGKMVLTVGTDLPKWLSSQPGDNTSIGDGAWFVRSTFTYPNNYSDYSELLRHLAKAERECGLKPDYIVLDEPDWMFYGTEKDAFDTFAAGAKGIRAGDPDAKIGALGVSGWDAKKASIPGYPTDSRPFNHSVLSAFVDYIAANPDTPVDFIDWHFSSPSVVAQQVKETRSWINAKWPADKAGRIFFSVGEGVFSPRSDYESTEKGASFLAAQYISFADAGISRYTATSLHDQYGWLSGTWQHVGFFSDQTKQHEEIIKPKWNAMKLLAKLGGNALEPEIIAANSTYANSIFAAASKNNTRTSLLVSYHPQIIILAGCMRDKGYDAAAIASAGVSSGQIKALGETLQAAEAGIFSADDSEKFFDLVQAKLGNAPVSAELKDALETCISENRPRAQELLAPQQFTMKFTNLENGDYKFRIYTIDANHSNSYRFNERTGEIDKRVAAALAGPVNARDNAAEAYLSPLGYSSRDASLLLRTYDACAKQNWYDTTGKGVKCFQAFVEANYTSLDRYKPGVTVSAMEDEITSAAKAGAKAYSNAFSTSDFYRQMDAINRMPGVALEPAEKSVRVENGQYEEKIIAIPYSVVYAELEKQ